jgi:hypothetical protein
VTGCVAATRNPLAMRDRDSIDSEFRLLVLAGRGRTLIGHQNQRPSRAAMEGVMNERTTNVSNIRPGPMVVPT